MMNDNYYDPYQQKTSSSTGRWLAFGLILILGLIGVVGIGMMPVEVIPLYMVFYIPMIVFGLYATYRWAKGKTIAPTALSEDERILKAMRKHALPAQTTSNPDTYGCPNCGNLFSPMNAMPVDEDVIRCPFCDTRLYLA